ncbi:hypothetical protein N7470_002778 [Penicillium chermesinum]|nr:hypothetical protein N7470_002778 [Penicillium chermesinum]
MDYMSGKRLDEVWDILDSSPKVSIADELHSYINQLRDLKGGNWTTYLLKVPPLILKNSSTNISWEILRHYAKYAFTDNHDIVFTHSDIAHEIFSSREAMSQQSSTGKMLDGTQHIGNTTLGLFDS